MEASRTAAVFESLQLGSFPEDWVKSCWDDDFVDLNTLPLESEQILTESEYLREQLKSANDVLTVWLDSNNQNENGEGFWSALVEYEIPHKSLIAVLAYITNNSAKVSAGFAERAAGILSASVYLKLVALPGSSAFKIYNPELFLQACRLLNKWNKTDSDGKKKRKRSPTPVRNSQKSQGGKRGKKQKRRPNESSAENADLEADDEEGESEAAELSTREMQELDALLKQLLQDVLLICEKYSLRQSESTATQLLAVVIGLTRMSPESITEDMGKWDSCRCSPGILAYKAAYLLCQPFHGHVAGMTNEVCKQLLNHILMLKDGKQFSNLVQPVLLMRRQAVSFVRYLSKELGERCIASVKTLIQHVCFKATDKSDYRTHTAQAVCELLDCLPDIAYARMLEWLKKLSKYNKVSQRSFVVDIMSVLLDRPERRLAADVPPKFAEFATHKSMVCTMLSRCSDANASVRSRALVGFSSCISSKHSDVVNTIKDVITPVAVQGRPTAKHFVPTPRAVIRADSEDRSNNNNAGNENEAAEESDPMQEIKLENITIGQERPGEDSDVEEVGAQPGNKDSNTPQGGDGNKSFGHIVLTPGFNPYLPDTEGVISMFHRRAVDNKVMVRKSALQALQNIIQFEAPNYRKEDLALLQERCADPALSVRKQATQSLSDLLHVFPADTQIQRAWVFGMLPQVMDRETSVQEKCFDLLEEMILQNLRPVTRASSIEWDLLNIIADETCEKLRRYLQKACQYWARSKKLKPAMVSAVQSHVGGQNDQAAWMFLAEIAKTPVKINHDHVVNHWKSQQQSVYDDAACTKWSNVLNVLGATAKSIPPETVTSLLDDLKGRLHLFSYPAPIIAGMVNCVSRLFGSMAPEASQRSMQAWGEELMADCDKYLSNVILNVENNAEEMIDEEQLIRYMFTLGEVCQRCPTRMPRRAALLIQSIVAAPCLANLGHCGDHTTQPTEGETRGTLSNGHSGQSEQQESSHDSNGNHSEERDSHITEPAPSQNSQPDSQMGSSQTRSSQASQFTQPLSQFRGSNMPHKLRAHAFITLGKLCLVDESLAKKTIAALARELEESDSPAVRNNVVIVMGDLTIRYTTLVDRYITNIAACLKDPSPLVRKNTLTILTRLLQEEYVKWKGVLFFRYITTLLDEGAEIRTLAEFCLEHLLLQKHPNMFFHPFLECIFHFNNYQTHAVYNKFTQTEREKHKFTLAGKENASKRLRLYLFMLEHMKDEQRFKTTAKLNKEILSAIVDQIIPLDKEGSSILQDALAILSSKEIKLSTMRSRGVEDTGEEPPDMAQIVTATAKKVLITQVVKRNVIENIVPVVISLKHMLEKNRSPLLKDLMGYLRELMKDYKNEVKDILAADRQLAEEIEFDLRNFENQQAERAAAANRQGTASRGSTPASSRPSTPVVSLPTSRQSSRAGSPVVNLNPALREVPGTGNVPAGRPDGQDGGSGRSSPVAGKPSRRASLTIVDAAKKAMSRVDQLRQTGSPVSPRRKSSTTAKSRQAGTGKTSSEENSRRRFTPLSIQDTENDENTVMSPSDSNSQTRAISTPTDGMYNITFGVDANVTMIPPSPIPSVACAKHGGKLCLSPQVEIRKNGDKDIICMPHPEAKDPAPQKWRIESPNAKRAEPDVTNSCGTPSRKAHTASRAGLRRTGRHKKT